MARAAGEDLTQALGFIAKTARAFGQLFFHWIVRVDIVRRAETSLRRRDPYAGLPQKLAHPHHLRIGGLPPLVGTSQDTDPTIIIHSDVVGDYGSSVIGVCHLVQRQIEIIRLLQGTDALSHGSNVWTTDRQTAAAEALHELHSRQIKGQITVQSGEKTAVQAIILA